MYFLSHALGVDIASNISTAHTPFFVKHVASKPYSLFKNHPENEWLSSVCVHQQILNTWHAASSVLRYSVNTGCIQ